MKAVFLNKGQRQLFVKLTQLSLRMETEYRLLRSLMGKKPSLLNLRAKYLNRAKGSHNLAFQMTLNLTLLALKKGFFPKSGLASGVIIDLPQQILFEINGEIYCKEIRWQTASINLEPEILRLGNKILCQKSSGICLAYFEKLSKRQLRQLKIRYQKQAKSKYLTISARQLVEKAPKMLYIVVEMQALGRYQAEQQLFLHALIWQCQKCQQQYQLFYENVRPKTELKQLAALYN